jgi:NADH-quinone oxidoreductase subunit I
MIQYFKTIYSTARALIKGLRITLKYFFKPAVTLQFPYEKKTMSQRFRGALAFHPEVCISCDMCVRVCPSDCISLESQRNEKGKKELGWYQIDFAKCNFCRLCEEICPTKPKSVHHTLEYELAFSNRNDFIVRWEGGSPQDTVNTGPEGQAWAKNWAPYEAPASIAADPSRRSSEGVKADD